MFPVLSLFGSIGFDFGRFPSRCCLLNNLVLGQWVA